MGTRESLSDYSALRRAVRAPLRHWWWRVGVWWVLVWALLSYFEIETQSWLNLSSLLPSYQWIEYAFAVGLSILEYADAVLVAIGFVSADIAYVAIMRQAESAGLKMSGLARGTVFNICFLPAAGLLLLKLVMGVASAFLSIQPHHITIHPMVPVEVTRRSPLLDALGRHSLEFAAIGVLLILLIALLIATGKRRYSLILLATLFMPALLHLLRLLSYWLGILSLPARPGLYVYASNQAAVLLGALLGVGLLGFAALKYRRAMLACYCCLLACLVVPSIAELPSSGWAHSLPKPLAMTLNVLGGLGEFLNEAPAAVGPNWYWHLDKPVDGYLLHVYFYAFTRELQPDWLALVLAMAFNLLWLIGWWVLIRYVIFGWLVGLKQRG